MQIDSTVLPKCTYWPLIGNLTKKTTTSSQGRPDRHLSLPGRLDETNKEPQFIAVHYFDAERNGCPPAAAHTARRRTAGPDRAELVNLL